MLKYELGVFEIQSLINTDESRLTESAVVPVRFI